MPEAAPKVEATAPKPEPAKPAASVALAQAPVVAPEPAKPVAEPAKPKVTKATTKPKATPKTTQAVAQKRASPAAQSAELKRPSGPKYNDLMTAVLYGDVESVNELLKLGKWVDKPDSRGVTPLMVAAERGDLKAAEALLRGGANARLAVPVAEERRHGEMVLLLKRYAGR